MVVCVPCDFNDYFWRDPTVNIVAVVDAQYMYMCVTTFDACHLARPVVTEMRG